jgi:hypothetical protein
VDRSIWVLPHLDLFPVAGEGFTLHKQGGGPGGELVRGDTCRRRGAAKVTAPSYDGDASIK